MDELTSAERERQIGYYIAIHSPPLCMSAPWQRLVRWQAEQAIERGWRYGRY